MLIELAADRMRGKRPAIAPGPGTWICGGAVRQWFCGNERESDIDIFGVSAESLSDFSNKIVQMGAREINNTPMTVSLDLGGKMVQVIQGRVYPTVESALDSFDFNVCQFAWDGSKVFATAEALIGTLRGHLAVHKIAKEFAVDSLRRAFKYQRKGYVPCAGTLRDLSNILRTLSEDDVKRAIEISPGGGKRVVSFD